MTLSKMTKAGLISLIFALPQWANASPPPLTTVMVGIKGANHDSVIHPAKNGADDGADHDRNDDKGGRRDRSSTDDNDHESGKTRDRSRDRSGTDDSGSGRSKPRIPGGSGCDSAGDIAEHPECSI